MARFQSAHQLLGRKIQARLPQWKSPGTARGARAGLHARLRAPARPDRRRPRHARERRRGSGSRSRPDSLRRPRAARPAPAESRRAGHRSPARPLAFRRPAAVARFGRRRWWSRSCPNRRRPSRCGRRRTPARGSADVWPVSDTVQVRPPSARVQHARARRAGDPAMPPRTAKAAKSKWSRIAAGISPLGGLPRLAQVARGQHQPAVAHQPTAGRRDELHAMQGPQTKIGRHGLDGPRGGPWPGGRRGPPGLRSFGSMKSPVSQPRLSLAGKADQVRPPSSVAKTPEGKSADGCPSAQPCCGSKKPIRATAGSISLRSTVQCSPPSRVRSTTPLDGMRVGLRVSAGRPADLGIQKEDARQAAFDARGLQLPMLAAVGRVPDRAAIAHGPAMLRRRRSIRSAICASLAIGGGPTASPACSARANGASATTQSRAPTDDRPQRLASHAGFS